ncbi:HlyD family secretion protein [Sphingobacterium sp. Mn56C]|uniref:HlyD family secretion protein n=1 Tax=Sphingobacterium sp. Mn56C TaxID=3395261 RepID=UPI003BCE4826
MENKTIEKKPKPAGIAINSKQLKSSRAKRKIIIINTVTFLVIAAGFYAIIVKYFHIGDKNYTESAQVEEFINPINTRVSAYINDIKFNEHQKVKKGDTLLVLDNREILTQVEQAEAAYLSAMAAKNVTSSTVNTVANNIAVLDANREGAQARLWNAEQNMHRYENLLASEAVTQQQYDQVKTEYIAAKAAYDAVVNQKNTTNLSVSETKTRLGLNDADIKRSKAALDMARLNLSYTIITAPYDGVMGRRLINEGQLLQAGQQVATIVLNDTKWVTANFLESQMPKIKVGTTLRMRADALNGKAFEGVVTAISAATGSRYAGVPVDNSTGNFVKVQQRIPVRIEFTAGNHKEDIEQLRVGMNMNILLEQ